MTVTTKSPKTERDHDTVKILLAAAVFWAIVGVGVWQVKSTLSCVFELGSDLTNSCAAALEEPFVIGPLHARIANAQANRLFDAADYQGAISVSEELANGKFRTHELHNLRGRAFAELQDNDKALTEYKKAFALQPDNESYFNDVVSNLRELKRLDEAVRVTSDFASRNPESSYVFYWWGSLEEDRGNADVAVEKYSIAITLDPNDHYSMKGKARNLVVLKKYDEALAEYGNAIVASNNDTFTITNRASLFERLGRYKEAQADYLSILERERPTEVLVSLAENYTEEGNYAAAKPLLDEALALGSDDARNHIAMIEFQLAQRQFEAALKGVAKLKPISELAAIYWQARIDADMGKLESAIAGYQSLLPIWLSDSDVRRDLGHALIDANRAAEALPLFSEAISFTPKNFSLFEGRSRAYLSLGNWASAVYDATTAIDLAPGSGIAFAYRAMAFGNLKNYENARQDFERAELLRPEVDWIFAAHFDMLLMNKKLVEAAQFVAELEKSKPGLENLQALKERLLQAQSTDVQATAPVLAEATLNYVDDQDQSEKALGLIMGQILVVGLEKACPQVRDIMKTSKPDQINLLLADENVSKFSRQECIGQCDILQMNNALVACKKMNGRENCFVIGAAFQNSFHILAVDAYAKRLQDVCK